MGKKVNLDQCVVENDDGTWDAQCPVTDGSCGTRPKKVEDRVPFRSTGWPSRKVARARLDQHVAEHKGEGVADPLEEFRAKQGLSVGDDGNLVRVEDLP